MKRILILLAMHIFYLFAAPVCVFSTVKDQMAVPLQSSGALNFSVDVYQFKDARDKTRLEICYSIDVLELEKQPHGAYTLLTELQLTNSQNQVIKNISEIKSVLADSVDKTESFFIDIKKFIIAADTLELYLSIVDSVSGKSGVVKTQIQRESFSSRFSLGSPVFVSSLQKAIDSSIFNRGNALIVPNPSRTFNTASHSQNMLVYFEINNMQYNPENPSLYSVSCAIADVQNNTLQTLERPFLEKQNSDISRVEKLDIDSLKSGVYRLHIRTTDLASNETDDIQRYFYVHSNRPDSVGILPMSEENIQDYYDQIKYIASKEEILLFKKLDTAGKQHFLLQFWKDKDPDPQTLENEFMLEHFRRIAWCKEYFRGGINSDMGRIYIVYGPPIEIERHVSSMGYSKPTQIWTYNLEGRVEFVFVDRTNDDNYMLMHSTHSDEISNYDWAKDKR